MPMPDSRRELFRSASRRTVCFALAMALLLLAGCGESPAPASQPGRQAAAQPVKAEIVDAPVALGSGRKSAAFTADNLFGFPDLPGGNVGEFVSENGVPYQRFAISHRTEAGATITLASLVRHLTDMKTIHGYEGFRGPLEGKNAWVFRHKKVVAGVIGLPDNEAKVEMARMAYSLR